MKIDFTSSEVGDPVWSPEYGEDTIKAVSSDEREFLVVSYYTYTISGRFEPDDLHPSLFHSLAECKEYWAEVEG